MEQVELKNSSAVDASHKILIELLQDFAILEPKVQIRTKCQPPILPPVTKHICSSPRFGNAFTGEVNTKPPKIGILVQFGFSVDELEIYLNEVYDLVDRFFILESTKSHLRTLPKALIWEKVKLQKRFAGFSEKIVHFLVDDADVSDPSPSASSLLHTEKTSWTVEALQEKLRWMKFKAWNERHNYFEGNDLLGNTIDYTYVHIHNNLH